MMGGMQNWMLRSVEFCIICLFILVQSASAQNGFVSIACCAETSFSDNNKLNWISDDEWFPDKKSCHHITSGAVTDRVRVFPIDSGKRCYSLQTNREQDYLIRATFLSGNNPVSRLGSLFDVLIGVTPIRQVNSSEDFSVEGIFRATRQEIDFCLAQDQGDPFISKLELRPLYDGKYLQGNYSSNVLRLVSRIDAGNAGDDIRYPDDPFDRIWHSPDSGSVSASSPATSGGTSLRNATTTVPLRVLRTALTHTDKLEFLHKDLDMEYHNYTVFLYFLELNDSVQISQRVFNIYINNEMQQGNGNFDILAMGSNYREAALNVVANGSLNLTLVKVETGYDLGPILNAYEILQMHSWSQETNQDDVDAMASVRRALLLHNKENQLLQSWSGDPCHPHNWTGVTCKYRNGSSVITQLDISSSQLQGRIPTSIIELNYLTDLNLSYNGFTSMVPEFFSTSKLTSVDLSNNNLMGILPDSLILLPYLTTLYFGCNPLLSAPSFNSSRLKTDSGECDGEEASNKRGLLIGSIAFGSLLLTLAAGIIFACICGQKFKTRGKKFHGKMAQNAVFSIPSTDADFLKSITIQSFTLEHLESATQQYKTMIGEGGFGSVYRGTLSSGQEVAVKVRSSTSTQGTREFENELNLLSAIRHENLVPLLGYCCEHEQQILVYPFMSNGSLQDRLYGEAAKRKTLDWPTRLSIALGAARGLTYLHTFSGRCVIHRDVKSSNILLDHSMNAKVADFGFSKYAPQEGDSCASLEVRGTAGYLDPEYYSTQHLSVKSDVFSFGVVLLEIVSGREPLNVSRPRNEWSLVEWAKPYIRESRIDEIVDPNIKGAYHAEAMWRVVEVASTCIETFSAYRPFMPDIVRELEDALIIENNASEYMKSIDSLGGYSLGGSNRFSIVMDKRITLPPPAPSPPEPSPINTKALAPPEPR